MREERFEVGFEEGERNLWFWGVGKEICVVGAEPDCLLDLDLEDWAEGGKSLLPEIQSWLVRE